MASSRTVSLENTEKLSSPAPFQNMIRTLQPGYYLALYNWHHRLLLRVDEDQKTVTLELYSVTFNTEDALKIEYGERREIPSIHDTLENATTYLTTFLKDFILMSQKNISTYILDTWTHLHYVVLDHDSLEMQYFDCQKYPLKINEPTIIQDECDPEATRIILTENHQLSFEFLTKDGFCRYNGKFNQIVSPQKFKANDTLEGIESEDGSKKLFLTTRQILRLCDDGSIQRDITFFCCHRDAEPSKFWENTEDCLLCPIEDDDSTCSEPSDPDSMDHAPDSTCSEQSDLDAMDYAPPDSTFSEQSDPDPTDHLPDSTFAERSDTL